MKKALLFFVIFTILHYTSKAQYNSITFNLIENENFMGVARPYLVNTNTNNNDEVNYHVSLIRIATEIQSIARNNSLPWVSSNFENAIPIDLFGGKFEMYKFNYGQRIDKIQPLLNPNMSDVLLRMVIIRPKDNIQRPLILVTHGAGACTDTQDPFWAQAIDFLGIPDLLMRGYAVAYYENLGTCRIGGNALLNTYMNSIYKVYENTGISTSAEQRIFFLALLTSTAAAKFTSGISQKINIQPYLYTLGHSYGGFSAINLALANPGLNYNHSIFQYLNDNNPNFTYFTLDQYKNSPIGFLGTTVLASALPDPNTNDNKIGDFFDNSDRFVGITMMHGKNDNEIPINYKVGNSTTLSKEGPLTLINRINSLNMNNAMFINCYSDHLFYARPTSFNPTTNTDITTLKNAISTYPNFPVGIPASTQIIWNGYIKYHQQQYEFNSYVSLINQQYYQWFIFTTISICFDQNGYPTTCPPFPRISVQEYVRPQSCTAYPMICSNGTNDSWQLTTCNPTTGNRLANNEIDFMENISKIESFQKQYSIISPNPKLPDNLKTILNNQTINNLKLRETGISFYPNPATNNITVSVEKPLKSSISVNLIDVTGKIVSSQLLPNNIMNHSLDVSSLANGIYMIQFSNQEFTAIDKFVKE